MVLARQDMVTKKKIKNLQRCFRSSEVELSLSSNLSLKVVTTIFVPSLPGCLSYGNTFEEAMEMIKDAMAECWMLHGKKASPFLNNLKLSSWQLFN